LGSSRYGPDAPRPYRRALCATKSNINSGEPCSFTKVPDGPQTQNLNGFRVQERNPDILFFSLKSPGKRNPSRFPSPTGPVWRRRPVYRAFCISLKNLIFRVPRQWIPPSRSPSWNPSQRDVRPLETSFIHLSKSPVYDLTPHSRFPSDGRGPHGERCPYPETFLTYIPGSPVKELPPRPPPRSLFRERCSISRDLFIQLSKSPVPEPTPGCPTEPP